MLYDARLDALLYNEVVWYEVVMTMLVRDCHWTSSLLPD